MGVHYPHSHMDIFELFNLYLRSNNQQRIKIKESIEKRLEGIVRVSFECVIVVQDVSTPCKGEVNITLHIDQVWQIECYIIEQTKCSNIKDLKIKHIKL